MSFTPVVPLGGYGGWAFLQRTLEGQKAAHAASPQLKGDEAYFRDKIATIGSAEELVADHRLLKIALGAFGLDDDIQSKFFIRKVLEEGTDAKTDLANKLSDKQYAALSEAFGFGTLSPNTKKSGFADTILAQYRDRQFEIAVGEQNNDMRLALNAERELPALAKSTSSDQTKWYGILGSEPLREVFQTAFGLPTSFGSIDIDQQISVLKDRMQSLLGTDSPSAFSDPDQMDKLMKRFLAMSQINGSSGTAATSPALQILQSGQGSAASILSLLL